MTTSPIGSFGLTIAPPNLFSIPKDVQSLLDHPKVLGIALSLCLADPQEAAPSWNTGASLCLALPQENARWIRAWSDMRGLDIAPLPNALAALYQEKEIASAFSIRRLWIDSGPRADTDDTTLSLILTREGHWMALSSADESTHARLWRETALMANPPSGISAIPAFWKRHGLDVPVADIGTFIAPVGTIDSAHEKITLTKNAGAATPLYRRILGAANNDDQWMGQIPWGNPILRGE